MPEPEPTAVTLAEIAAFLTVVVAVLGALQRIVSQLSRGGESSVTTSSDFSTQTEENE